MIETPIYEIKSKNIRTFDRMWREKCRDRPLPSFGDFSKSDLYPFLSGFIVAKRRFDRSYYLFVGGVICRAARMDFAGYYLDEIEFPGEPNTDWNGIHRRIVTDRLPVIGAGAYSLPTGEDRRYLTALYPFSSDGRTIDYIASLEDWLVDSATNSDSLDGVLPVELRDSHGADVCYLARTSAGGIDPVDRGFRKSATVAAADRQVAASVELSERAF